MAIYRVKSPDGTVLRVQGPDGASQAQVAAMAQAMYPQHQAAQDQAARKGPLGAADALVRGVANGATFGWDKPLTAAINTVAPLDELTNPGVTSVYQQGGNGSIFDKLKAAYAQNMNVEQRTDAADQEVHPVLRTAGQVGGTVAGTLLGGRALGAVAPVTTARVAALGPVAAGTVVGGATGAVSGAGNARPGTRVAGALLGGGLGAVTGSAISGTVAGLAPVVARYANAFLGKGTTQEALGQMVRALSRDGYDVTSPKGVLALKTELNSFGDKPVSLADLGNAIRARAGVGLRTPSAAQPAAIDTVLNRQAGSADRLSTDITNTVAPRTDVHALDADLVAQRAATALPLRQAATAPANAALNKPATIEDVLSYMQRPDVQEALKGVNPTNEGPKTLNYPEGPLRDADSHQANLEEISQSMTELHNGDASPKDLKVYPTEDIVDAIERGLIPNEDDEELDTALDFLKKNRKYDVSTIKPNSKPLPLEEAGGYDNLPPTPEQQAAALPAIGPDIVPNVPTDPVLHALTQLPEAQPAVLGAAKQANAQKNLLTALGQDTSHLPEFPEGDAPLDMNALDYVKKYMDNQVNSMYASPDASVRAQAAQMQDLRDALRSRMKQVSPEYADYLGQWSDSTGMLNALKQGRGSVAGGPPNAGPGFMRLDPEAIASIQAKASPTEAELGRVGYARALDDTVQNTQDSAQPALRILQTPVARARLAASGVSDADVQSLTDAVQQERTMGQLTGELKGSQTDARLAARGDADAGLSTDHLPYNPTQAGSWLGMLASKTVGAVNLARNADVNDQVLPRLLSQDPVAIGNTINEMMQQGQMDQATALRNAAIAKYGAGAFGSAIGSPVTWQPQQGN